MTDQLRPPNEPSDDSALDAHVLAELSTMLGDSALWEEPSAADEDAIVDAIKGLASGQVVSTIGVEAVIDEHVRAPQTDVADNVVPLSGARRWLGPVLAGVAAAVIVLAGFSLFRGAEDPAGVELVLSATELAPDAEGVVDVIDTPNGTRLLLDVSGLPPAPAGSYYEAWVRKDAEVGVSAGTFHLRGGGGDIELWAGVTTDDYPLFTVTIQQEGDVMSSGQVVLRGRIGE